jgi:hypothetical protein
MYKGKTKEEETENPSGGAHKPYRPDRINNIHVVGVGVSRLAGASVSKSVSQVILGNTRMTRAPVDGEGIEGAGPKV